MAGISIVDIEKLEEKLKKIDNLKPTEIVGSVQSPHLKIEAGTFRSLPLDSIEQRYIDALDQVAEELSMRLDESISASVWSWKGSSRDIIDSGALKESKKVIVVNNKIEVSYDQPYATLVHYGGYIYPYGNRNAQKVYIPGRPWVGSLLTGNGPIPKFDFELSFKNAMS